MKCPYCNKENKLSREHGKEIEAYGKVVICCIECDKLFTIRDDGEGLFIKSVPKNNFILSVDE